MRHADNEAPAELALIEKAQDKAKEARFVKTRYNDDNDDDSEGIIGHTGTRALDLDMHINLNPGW